MKQVLSILAIFLIANHLSAQCPCSGIPLSGSSFGGGSGYDQNSANNFCIATGTTYTGTLPQTNGGSLVICGTWAPTSSFNLNSNAQFDITNEGTLDMNGNDFRIQNKPSVFTNNGTMINVGTFEVAESQSELVNNGSITGENFYLHGTASNFGTMTSTAECGSAATSSCGFYVGDKSGAFNNEGTITAVDMTVLDDIVGGGDVTVTSDLRLGTNGGQTDNNWYVEGVVVNSGFTGGSFEISGVFNCNSQSYGNAVICFTPTGSQNGNCAGQPSGGFPACSTLPAVLIDFKYKNVDNELIFNWETGDEINFSHFELQRSTDERNYETIELLSSKGSGSIYQSRKVTQTEDLVYYRLKRIDYNGYFEYSEVLSYNMRSIQDKYIFELSPNPVGKGSLVNVKTDDSESKVLTVYTLEGKSVFRTVMTENYLLSTDVIMNKGIYILEIAGNGYSKSQKLIVN